jgi:anti-sigma-K factor RskA
LTESACDEVTRAAAEVALGVATAEERARVVEHVEGCAACRDELRGLSEVADALAALAPAAEPPPGFEDRVLALVRHQTGVDQQAQTHPRRRAALAFAAVAATAAAVAVGWALGATGHQRLPATAVVANGTLVSRGQTAGDVVVVDGRHPWISVTVRSDLGDQEVACDMIDADGGTITVGWFRLVDGRGHWVAGVGQGATRATTAELVAYDGQVVARADLREAAGT